MHTLNFTELQQEVQDKWEDEGVATTKTVELTTDPYLITETVLKDKYERIINDPEKCVQELGFDSLASYIASKQDEPKAISLGYALITKTRTKFFYDNNGQTIEFYIDRSPNTSSAQLTMRPAEADAIQALMSDIIRIAQ